MRPALPPDVDATINPALARVEIPLDGGLVLVLVLGSRGPVAALWVLGGSCVDVPIARA